MIKIISIAETASYGPMPERMDDLKKINFIFGSNGSGKTSIGRVIADGSRSPACTLVWENGTTMRTMVYNQDFIANNFNQPGDLKGIFTLGEQSIEVLNKITGARTDIATLTKTMENLNFCLSGEDGASGKVGELTSLEEEFKSACWVQKRKHDAKFEKAFTGLRSDQEKFKAKVLQEAASNTAALTTLEDLEKRASVLFGDPPTLMQLLPEMETEDPVSPEAASALRKKVVGKVDVDIAAMIQKLQNSDWVREGRQYFEQNEGKCPFCQQETSGTFAKSLSDYFDETFERDTKAIADFELMYAQEADQLQTFVAELLVEPNRFFDAARLKLMSDILSSRLALNKQRIAQKRREPSGAIELDAIADILADIGTLIDAANTEIRNYNSMVENFDRERKELIGQVWKYILDVELREALPAYRSKRAALDKAIVGLRTKLTDTEDEKTRKIRELRDLEKRTTSVRPTVDAINDLLGSFGFVGFALQQVGDSMFYKLVRPDGSEAKETLSEGEKSFVTFLYFYQLMKGSDTESGVAVDRIVVFDDPVSSLDSDVLFIVSTLIKGIFEEVRAGAGHIKQAFVFTHNVYFHKEVAFNRSRRDIALSDETFWIVKKAGLLSRIERHENNPIKTSYELLWAEIRNPSRSDVALQNTMRRILENYFTILGDVDPDAICTLFDGREKLVCKSLFLWVNAGSHDALDDLYTSTIESCASQYLGVFRSIFDRSGHLAHYRMMMGDAFEEAVPVAVRAAAASADTPISSY